MSRKVIITQGLPASGKSSWATQVIKDYPNQYKRINKDLLREMFDASQYGKGNEKFIIKVRNLLITQILRDGKSIIIDDTNLKNFHIEDITKIVKDWNISNQDNVQVEIKSFLDIPLETCIERDLIRPNSLGPEKITNMWHKYKKDNGLTTEIEYQTWMATNPDLPNCVISDIDGTMALRSDRGIYEFDKANLDKVSEPIRDLVNNQKKMGDTVIIMSAREDKYQPITEQWLKDNGVLYDFIYMRPTGDMREDSKIKEDLYNRYILNRFNVRWVVDDRARVCNLWRKLSLLCLQVQEGNY